MSIFVAIFLGIVQGLTEFLPVSSSGHLVLLQNIFGISVNVMIFDVILHIGTLFAVVFVFRKQVWELVKHPFSKKMGLLILATIPAVIIVLLFNDFVERSFSGEFLIYGFALTAVFLLLAQYYGKRTNEKKKINYISASVMGLFQGFAILPGISRSGSTISSAIVQGIDKSQAAEFSFLMSIPIILASGVYEVIGITDITPVLPIIPMVAGFLFSIVCGIFAIKIMLKIVQKSNYKIFAFYLILLSLFLILNKYVLFLF